MLSSASHPSTPFPTQPNSVYQYFDAYKILIYVGITKTGTARNRQHNSDKAWWPLVAEQSVEHFTSREAAHAREVELITMFRPPSNVQHNPDHADIRAAYIALQQSGELAMNVKQLIATGKKGRLPLVPVGGGQDKDHIYVSLVPHLVDRAIVACAARLDGRAGAYDRIGNRIGTVSRIESQREGVTVTVVLRKEMFSCMRRVLRATARMKYVSLKLPVRAEITAVTLEFAD